MKETALKKTMQLFSSLLFPKPKSDSMTRESNVSCGEQGRWSLTKEYNVKKVFFFMQEPTLTSGQCRKWQNERNSFIIILFIYVRSALFLLMTCFNFIISWKEITWKLIWLVGCDWIHCTQWQLMFGSRGNHWSGHTEVGSLRI